MVKIIHLTKRNLNLIVISFLRLYTVTVFSKNMAINALVIHGSDPGAVPGDSTKQTFI